MAARSAGGTLKPTEAEGLPAVSHLTISAACKKLMVGEWAFSSLPRMWLYYDATR